MQKMVSLQEAVEGTEDGGVDHYGQWDGSSSGQSGKDEAPAGDESRTWTFRAAEGCAKLSCQLTKLRLLCSRTVWGRATSRIKDHS